MQVPESFAKGVIDFVKTIPHGKVVSYGQVANHMGTRDARMIGWVLHSAGTAPGVPWWRVVNNEGKITINELTDRVKQKDLLVAEGVEVNSAFVLNIDRYRYGSVPGQKTLL